MPNPTRRLTAHSTNATYGALEQRVFSAERDLTSVRQDVHEIRGRMASREDVVGLNVKLDDVVKELRAGARTNWVPLLAAAAVVLTIVGGVGHIVLTPVDADLKELKEARLHQYRTEGERFVPRNEYDVRRELVDKELDHLKEAQIDLTDRFGSTYTIRDALEDIQKRIDRLQANISGNRNGGFPP